MMNGLLAFMIVIFGFSVLSWAADLPVKAVTVTEATVESAPIIDSAAIPVEDALAIQETVPAADMCRDMLPQVERDYSALGEKYQQIKSGQLDSYDGYTGSFGEMTEVLFELTEAKEQETKRISESRDQLKNSVQNFNEDRSPENSKLLQDHYMDLTVRLYSSVMDGQKILATLKSQLSKVEANRSQFENSKLELEKIDHQRLALEAKLINLKIRCQADR